MLDLWFCETTIITKWLGEWLPGMESRNLTLWIADRCRAFHRLRLDVMWLKEDRNGGEKDRKVELGEEIYGRSTRTHEHKFPKKQTFQNHLRFSFTSFYFIEEEGCFGETTRRCNFRVLSYPTNENLSFVISWKCRWLLECHDAGKNLIESEVFRLFSFRRSVRVILTSFHAHIVSRLA